MMSLHVYISKNDTLNVLSDNMSRACHVKKGGETISIKIVKVINRIKSFFFPYEHYSSKDSDVARILLFFLDLTVILY